MLLAASLVLLGLSHHIDDDPKETPVLKQLYRPVTHGPTLTEITMRATVKAATKGAQGTITFPAPSDYSGQVIVSIEVRSNPPGALKTWVWKNRIDRLNSTILAQVVPEGSIASVWYTALVLTPSEPVYRTIRTGFRPWLAPTECVQAADPAIKRLAARLALAARNRDAYVDKVVMWVARSGLAAGGSSMSRANLCAALLRTHGIPARTVAHMPTWAYGKFNEQWLTEYWTEEGVWCMVEPTIGVKHPGRNSVIVLAISSPEDENLAFDKQHVRGNMSGTPFLSAPELSMGLVNVVPKGSLTNEVHLLKTFPNRSESLVMPAGYRRSLRVLEAAAKGSSTLLGHAEVLKAVADPYSFASFLDGNP